MRNCSWRSLRRRSSRFHASKTRIHVEPGGAISFVTEGVKRSISIPLVPSRFDADAASRIALRDLAARLAPLRRDESPFADAPRLRDATWVEPRLVAQVGFTEWTRDGRLRHPRFLGLRDDKAAEEVVRE